MNILVIGGQGFIGYNLVQKLLNTGHNVVLFDRSNKRDISNCNCKCYFGNFIDIENHMDLFRNIDIVYHLVSTTLPKTSNENPCYDIESNVIATIKLLEACKKTGIRKLIYTSSGGTVYGIPKYVPIDELHSNEPICSYGITKLTIEKYLQMYKYLYGLDYQILRISNPYGPYQNPRSGQGAVRAFLGNVLDNKKIEIWGDGNVVRDYIYIGDVVEALYLSAIKDTGSHILNIGSGVGISLNELIDIIINVVGYKIKVNYTESRNMDVPINVLDITRAREELNWLPSTSIDDGIKKTWEWLKSNAENEWNSY